MALTKLSQLVLVLVVVLQAFHHEAQGKPAENPNRRKRFIGGLGEYFFLARKKRLNEVDSNNLDLDEGINEVGKEANNLDERDLRRAPYSPTGTYPPFPDDDDDYNYYTTGSPPPRRSTFRYDEDDWSFTTEQPRRSSSVLYDGYDWSFTTESPSRRPNTFEEHFNDFNEKVVPWVKTKWAKTKDYVKSKYKAASDLFG